jgi:ribosomal protein S18 acetylase RimI-like enzyme
MSIIDGFRKARKSDIETIVQLVNKAYRPKLESRGWTDESDIVSGERINAVQVTDAISKEYSAILLGFKDSEVVACVHVEKDGNNCHIGLFAVNPILQGSGCGKQMLDHAERYANENFSSEKFIMFVVSSRNELISFYLRRGYQKTGEIMDYPISAGVGTPKYADLKIEILEKIASMAIASFPSKTVHSVT